MIELVFSRMLAAVAAVSLIACAIVPFSQVRTQTNNDALRQEVEMLADAISAIPRNGSGAAFLRGEACLSSGHAVSLVGNVMMMHADGISTPIAAINDLGGGFVGQWTMESDLRISWDDGLVFLTIC
jgi:hypothetical protein